MYGNKHQMQTECIFVALVWRKWRNKSVVEKSTAGH